VAGRIPGHPAVGRQTIIQEKFMLVRRIFRFALPVLALTAGAILFSGCHRNHCGWGSSPEKKADRIAKHIAKELDLTAEQRTKLDKIKADILARKGEFTAVHAGLRETLLGQIRAAAVDTSKLNAGLDDREAKIKELRGFMVAEFAEFHAMLDSTQREKLASKLEKHCR
jgi:Spy/CpxP family protein refolding chaperone